MTLVDKTNGVLVQGLGQWWATSSAAAAAVSCSCSGGGDFSNSVVSSTGCARAGVFATASVLE